jgi:hypothetical protein
MRAGDDLGLRSFDPVLPQEAAFWRFRELAVPATTRPSRRTRKSCLSAVAKGRFPATSPDRSLAQVGQQLPVTKGNSLAIHRTSSALDCPWPFGARNAGPEQKVTIAPMNGNPSKL